jgi:hypothetical protein
MFDRNLDYLYRLMLKELNAVKKKIYFEKKKLEFLFLFTDA